MEGNNKPTVPVVQEPVLYKRVDLVTLKNGEQRIVFRADNSVAYDDVTGVFITKNGDRWFLHNEVLWAKIQAELAAKGHVKLQS